ncbi:MAG: hypothetical protein PUA83_04255 [Clostridiales bacterium]|nr:hypothetical protein [Clostridiales bacterium]
MYLLFDLCMIAIVAVALWRGYRRGIARSLIKLGLAFLSVFGASQLTRAITPVLASALPMPGVGTKLSSYIATNLIEDSTADVGELLTNWGFSGRAAAGIKNFIESRNEDFSNSIAKTLSEYIDSLLTEVLIFIFLLLTFLLISVFLYMLISNALEAPVLSTLDRVVGLSVSGIVSVAAVMIICFLVSWTSPLIDAAFDLGLTGLIAEKSIVIGITEKINPFFLLLG